MRYCMIEVYSFMFSMKYLFSYMNKIILILKKRRIENL